VSDEPRLRSIAAALLLLVGVAVLLIAVVLAVWTTVGWPKLTLAALLMLVAGGFLAAHGMRTPS
jgi:hypothetical protein